MEQPAAVFPLCTFIKSDGNRCGSPALSGMNLCFQHIGGRIPSQVKPKPESSGPNTRMNFVYPGDREAIQHNLFLVAQAFSDGKIDTAAANTYNRLFRSCDLNLRRWETAKQGVAQPMLPLPSEAPEPTGRQSFGDQDLPPARAAERACPELVEGVEKNACPEPGQRDQPFSSPAIAEGSAHPARPVSWEFGASHQDSLFRTSMKTGIIGLPQVGKTSLFRILTKAKVEDRGGAPGSPRTGPRSWGGNPRESHLGVAKVPDARLDKLSALYNPKKTTYATVEYSDVAAIGQEALKETAFLTNLRNVDALIHVLRAFEDDAIPHVGPIDPLRDIKNVEFDLMVSDLTQIEKRLERLEKDLKKSRTADLEKEQALLLRSKEALESEKSLRELEMSAEEKKLIRGFMFLSQKPILYAINLPESTTLGADLEAATAKYGLTEFASRPNAGVTAFCGKVEAELAEMEDEEAAEFLASYGLTESGLVRLIRKSYELQGLISFFTAGEDECRAWTVPVNSRAQEAAGAIHTDLEKHFIRAETIHWDTLLAAGSEAAAKAQGTLRLEGKDYLVKDGDVMHIRHSG